MTDLAELKTLVEDHNKALDQYHSQISDGITGLKGRIENLEMLSTMPGSGGVIGKDRAAAQYKAFGEFLRTGESKEMSIDGGATAGEALVPEFIANEIINRALAQSRLASIVRRSTSDTSDYVRLLNKRGQAASWSSETGTRSDTATMEFREIRPTHGELYSVVPVTTWLLQDSKFDVANMIVSNAVDQFAKSIELAIYSGDGSNKPTGLIDTAPTTAADGTSPERAADALQYISGTSDLADDIISLFFALKPEYRANASFVMSSATLAIVRQLRDASGSGFLWQQNLAQAMDAPDGLLMGRPVYTSENLPTISQGSPQALGIFCGDFTQGYELVSLGGMQILRDPYTSKGKVRWYISQRFGGRILDNDSIKLLAA